MKSTPADPEDMWAPTPRQSLGYAFRDAYRALNRHLSKKLEPYGLSVGQWYYLCALWEGEGLTQRELSDRVGAVETSTVDALAAMQAAGFVRRIPDPSDRRQRRVFLTRQGRGLKKRLLPLADEVGTIAAEGLTAEDLRFFCQVAQQLETQLTVTID